MKVYSHFSLTLLSRRQEYFLILDMPPFWIGVMCYLLCIYLWFALPLFSFAILSKRGTHKAFTFSKFISTRNCQIGFGEKIISYKHLLSLAIFHFIITKLMECLQTLNNPVHHLTLALSCQFYKKLIPLHKNHKPIHLHIYVWKILLPGLIKLPPMRLKLLINCKCSTRRETECI